MRKELSRAQRQIWTVLPGVTDTPPFSVECGSCHPENDLPLKRKAASQPKRKPVGTMTLFPLFSSLSGTQGLHLLPGNAHGNLTLFR